MADEQTIANVATSPVQNGPGTAAGLSVGKDMLVVLAGISTIWTVFSATGLSGVYNWLNSIPGAPFLSLAGLAAVSAWGATWRWINRKRAQQQRAVVQTIATAPPTVAQTTVDMLRAATPAAEPLKELTL